MLSSDTIIIFELGFIALVDAIVAIHTYKHWGEKRYPCNGHRNIFDKK